MATSPKGPVVSTPAKPVSAPKAAPERAEGGAIPGEKKEKKEKKKKEKKEKVEKIEFRFDPVLFPAPAGDADWFGGPKLENSTLPAGYDTSKHKPLRRSDFKNEADFFEYRAVVCETEAVRFRKEAEDARKISATGGNKKTKRFVALQTQLTTLMKELMSDGQDVSQFQNDELIKAFMAKNS